MLHLRKTDINLLFKIDIKNNDKSLYFRDKVITLKLYNILTKV